MLLFSPLRICFDYFNISKKKYIDNRQHFLYDKQLKDFMLSDRYNELFYSYKGQYVMESLMYPMFMLFETTQLGDKETEYFHVILNMFLINAVFSIYFITNLLPS